MQTAPVRRSAERQLTRLAPTPGRCGRVGWSETGNSGTTALASSATAAVEDADAIEFVKLIPGKPPGNEAVLVVDDEPLVRETTAEILRQSGFRVLEASGASEAQQLIGTNPDINLLLTDFSMPGTNGLDLARWLQIARPGIKVLITTGATWKLADQVGNHEQFAVLPKPFDAAQLDRMVRQVLG